MLVLLLTSCTDRGPSIDALRAGGELRVALVSVPHTYFLEPDGILGFDYDLLRAFCAELGIQLKVTLVPTRAEATALVARRKVHLAAGLVPVSDALDTNIRFGPSYAMLRSRVIFRAGSRRPHSVEDLIGQSIETAGGGDVDLAKFAAVDPRLTFDVPAGASTEQVLARVDAGITDFAVVPSLDFDVLRLKYPQLETAFDVGPPRAVAWALSDQFQPDIDHTIVEFFLAEEQTRNRQLLWHRYYGHYGAFDFVDARAFLRAYDERLPEFRDFFEQAGRDVAIDWRLLAALSYQESHWDPAARSPTGVRGLMMLTRRTASEMNVAREEPAEAVAGGARYLADLVRRLPSSIEGEERLWFGLAAYNIGAGHLEDARKLTAQAGRNPNTWHDVRAALGQLSRPEVARQTRYGNAPGRQTLHFVSNIRRYLDSIRQLDRRAVITSDTSDEQNVLILDAL